ncbi:hypothetical protein P153DRAFT_133704 [Dothidotthia symphoricarpi CBS 119687]|uniref:Uncharacterized protein n=1 Tax=Dothidotthia symphoricarpi CBS 119687 TaxID=1392245 RepID=A0A6A6A054_9PLEO|nr:uncharacterized protein P153DRAFT_133704 [Dothidotthia symphoricarpi CBS 119687]KAF2124533.1 hypothetical protein P153DRAFT_133704 [Dothidotthia symphoricarpi CBS 119687]
MCRSVCSRRKAKVPVVFAIDSTVKVSDGYVEVMTFNLLFTPSLFLEPKVSKSKRKISGNACERDGICRCVYARTFDVFVNLPASKICMSFDAKTKPIRQFTRAPNRGKTVFQNAIQCTNYYTLYTFSPAFSCSFLRHPSMQSPKQNANPS